jgi:hypothetical protein
LSGATTLRQGGQRCRSYRSQAQAASCGPGCRGDYSVAVSYLVPRTEHGTIEVFESSAKNRLPVNVQLIPVTLTP